MEIVQSQHMSEGQEEEIMNEDEEKYEIWKRNVPIFYRSLISNVMEWGSLTC